MEFLNSIELRGIVGNAHVQTITGKQCASFSLCIEHSSSDSTGALIVETLWLNVTAWQSEQIPSLSDVKKGAHIYVKGRLRLRHFTDAFGESRTVPEVVAHLVKLEP